MGFLAAWTAQLHASGYLSGVYSSAASGIGDLAARLGTGFAEPDDIWIARWNGAQNTSDPEVSSADWADHQRLHQYAGDHNETYGGATLDIDSDYLDGATASAGTGAIGPTTTIASAPSVSLSPQANGNVNVRPSWSGMAVSRLAGAGRSHAHLAGSSHQPDPGPRRQVDRDAQLLQLLCAHGVRLGRASSSAARPRWPLRATWPSSATARSCRQRAWAACPSDASARFPAW